MKNRLNVLIRVFVFTSVVALLCVAYANAQPMATAPAPAPVAMAPATAGTAPTAMVAPVATMAATPDTMAAPVMASAPVAAAAPATTPVWKTPGFWVGIGSVVLGIVLTILVTFGVITKKHLDWLRRNNAVKIADNVVTQFENYAKGSNPKWDDVVAQALRAVVNRLGELTAEEQALVKGVVEERQEQAEKKSAGADTPPKVAETPKADG